MPTATKKTSHSSAIVKEVKPEPMVMPVSPGGWTVKDKIIAIQVVALTLCAFAVGLLYGKVSVYDKSSSTAVTAALDTESGQQAPQAQEVSIDQVKALFNDDNIADGAANRKVLFVEFSDPSCPWCHVASGKNDVIAQEALGDRYEEYIPAVPEMKKLVDEGKASYAWIYRNGHGNGELAAQLLYCAHDEGRFWPVHDLLMTNEGYTVINDVVKNDVSKLPELIKLISLVPNSAKIQSCVESGKYKDRVTQDMALGDQLGAGGTPHFLVNTTVFSGAQSFDTIQPIVDQALQ